MSRRSLILLLVVATFVVAVATMRGVLAPTFAGSFVGAVAGGVIGFTVATWQAKRHRHSGRVSRARRQKAQAALDAPQVTLGEVGHYLQGSIKGLDWILTYQNVLVWYTSRDQSTRDEKEALFRDFDAHSEHAYAVLYWLVRNRDWDRLALCLGAGLSPAEIIDMADGKTVVSTEQLQEMAALGDAPKPTVRKPS